MIYDNGIYIGFTLLSWLETSRKTVPKTSKNPLEKDKQSWNLLGLLGYKHHCYIHHFVLMVGTSFLVTIAIRLPCIYSSILRFAALTPGASAPALITSVSSSVSSASSRFFGCRNRPSQPEPFRDGRGFGNGREGTPRFFSYGVVGGWFSVVSWWFFVKWNSYKYTQGDRFFWGGSDGTWTYRSHLREFLYMMRMFVSTMNITYAGISLRELYNCIWFPANNSSKRPQPGHW